MGLPWVRLDATFPHNHKILSLLEDRKNRAINVYVFALAWSGHQTTDGFVPTYALPVVHGTRVEARQLVDAGLWDEYDGGWLIHDWADYQPSIEHRESVRARLDKARCAKAMKGGSPCTCGQH